jgi:hypothetical protein
MKQMSRYEVQSFPDFAPHYFNYLSAAFTEKVCLLHIHRLSDLGLVVCA